MLSREGTRRWSHLNGRQALFAVALLDTNMNIVLPRVVLALRLVKRVCIGIELPEPNTAWTVGKSISRELEGSQRTSATAALRTRCAWP